MKRYSKKEKKTRGKRIKSRKVAKGRKVKSRKNNRNRRTRTRKTRTRKVGGGIEEEPVISLSSFFQFPAYLGQVVLGPPKPRTFSKKRRRSNDPDLRNRYLLPTRGEKLSLFDHIRKLNLQSSPNIGFVEPDKSAEPLVAWPEVNEDFNIPVITPLGQLDYVDYDVHAQKTKRRTILPKINKKFTKNLHV